MLKGPQLLLEFSPLVIFWISSSVVGFGTKSAGTGRNK